MGILDFNPLSQESPEKLSWIVNGGSNCHPSEKRAHDYLTEVPIIAI